MRNGSSSDSPLVRHGSHESRLSRNHHPNDQRSSIFTTRARRMAATPTITEVPYPFAWFAVRVDRSKTSRARGIAMRSLEPIMLKVHACANLTLIPSSHLPHGEFGNWLKQNWEMEQAQAYRYMEVAMLNLSSMRNLTLITDAWRRQNEDS
jgi:hypothetical protein